MTIDFHTHLFPDKLAEKTVEHLAKISGYKPNSNATSSGNINIMDKYNIDKSVVCNIATNVKQTENVNRFAAETDKNDRFVSFGSVHPDCDFEYYLDFLKERGIKGIKLHPDYQGFFIDDKKLNRLYEAVLRRDFVLIFHTGVDEGIGEPVHATPERIKNVISVFRGERVVFAHMGGFKMSESAMELLCSEPIFFDTSCNERFVPFDFFEGMVKAHGTDKVLFGTDLPWSDPAVGLERIRKLNISEEEKEMILGKNAERLLRL